MLLKPERPRPPECDCRWNQAECPLDCPKQSMCIDAVEQAINYLTDAREEDSR